QPAEVSDTTAGTWPRRTWRAIGCPSCAATGYRGRLLLAELLTLDEPLRHAILAKSDTTTLETAVSRSGRQTLGTAADRAVANALSTPEEIERVLGPRQPAHR